MKKMVSILIILSITVISLGNFFIKDSVFMNFFYKKFDTTLSITAKPESAKLSIKSLQRIAKKNNVSFIKEEYAPMNGRYGKQVINVYLYLNEAKWFKSSFGSILITEKENHINAFEKANSVDILTRKEIRIKRFSSIDENIINGDYHLRGSDRDIAKFVNDLNNDIKSKINAEIVNKTIVSSDYTQNQVILYLVSTFILVSALLFCLLIYNGSISKELTISMLLGYKKMILCVKKSIALIWVPIVISIIIQVILLYSLVKPDTTIGFLFSAKKNIAIVLLIGLCICIIELILLSIKINSINLLSFLKGYRKTYRRTSYVFKILSIILTMSMIVISVFGFEEYIHLREHIYTWEKSRNYANIACAWPQSYISEDGKFQELVVPKLNNLWDKLDENGAILFLAPNNSRNGMEEDEEYLKNREFQGNYAYINSNYLNVAKIYDKDGNDIRKYKPNSNEWIIFVPENIRVRDFDKKMVHKTHLSQSIDKNNNVETYVKIRAKQRAFTFDTSMGIDKTYFRDMVLILINGKDILPDQTIKLPSLVNGNFHPHIDNPNKAYDSVKDIISNTQSSAYVLYVNSVYSEVNAMLNECKAKAMIYSVGVMLSIIILITILKIDRETYFYSDGKRIYVSRLFGYKFKDIHKSKIMKSITSYLISILVSNLIIMNIILSSGGWNHNNFIVCLLICTSCSLICFIFEMIILGKCDAHIVLRLKEGS